MSDFNSPFLTQNGISGSTATVTALVFTDNTQQTTAWTGTVAATNVTGLATVATSGSYNDLSNKPSLPNQTLNTSSNVQFNSIIVNEGPPGMGGLTFSEPGNDTGIYSNEDGQIDIYANNALAIQIDESGLEIKVDGGLTFYDNTAQYTAWTGSVSTSSVTGLSTIGYTVKLSDGTGQISTSTVAGLSTIGYTGKLSDGTGQISTSTVNGLSTVGYTNNYNDLINKPFIPSGSSDQNLYTTSSVTFASLGITTGTKLTQTLSLGGYPLDQNGQALISVGSSQSPNIIASNYSSILRPSINIRAYAANYPGGTPSTGGTGVLVLEGARGTGASPTATSSSDTIGSVSFGGYDGANWLGNQNTGGAVTLPPGQLLVQAAETFANNGTTTTNAGTNLVLRLQPLGAQLNSTSRVIPLYINWTAGSTATTIPPTMNISLGQTGGNGNPTQTPSSSVGSFGTGTGGTNLVYTHVKNTIYGVPNQDSAPDNNGILGSNTINFSTSRRSGFSGRRNPLLSGDTVFSIAGTAQTATNSTLNGTSIGYFSFGMLENATNTAVGSHAYIATVQTGTTIISNRVDFSDRANSYFSDLHRFSDKTGSFNALNITTSTIRVNAPSITFPDNTVQTTAYTGTAAVSFVSITAAQTTTTNTSTQIVLISDNGNTPAYYNSTISNWLYIGSNNIVYTPPASTYTINYLVVGGGGAGGFKRGGGGGAGGYQTGSYTVTPGTTYTITVGAGGAGGSQTGANGNSSSMVGTGISLTSTGGGKGAGGGGAGYDAGSGASGGGGTYVDGGLRNYGSGTAGQGYAGGAANSSYSNAGAGGGGAAAAGSPTSANNAGSNGGNGVQWLDGNYYAGGAGGGGQSSAGTGGLGGGANGQYDHSGDNGYAGTANTGGGGGPGGDSTQISGNGGSGVVVIQVLTSHAGSISTTGSPTITTAGSYTYYYFTGSGTFTS